MTTTEISENFLLHIIAKDIWDASHDTYSSKDNTSELLVIINSLQELRQGDFTIQCILIPSLDYGNRLTSLKFMSGNVQMMVVGIVRL